MDLQRIESELSAEMDALTASLARLSPTSVDQSRIGIRVWLLPERYFALHATGSVFRRRWHDAAGTFVRRPRLARALAFEDEKQYPPQPKRTIRWTLSKGLPGAAIFHEKDFETIIHGELDAVLGTMRFWDFYIKLDPNIRQGRSREDFVRLRRRYSGAVAHKLRPMHSTHAIGCITAHLPRGDGVDWELLGRWGTVLGDWEEDLVGRILNGYREPRASRSRSHVLPPQQHD